MARILYHFLHPALERSRINRQLLTAATTVPDLTVSDLYQKYPRFTIDTPTEQAALEAHDTIVFQFPLYWYSSPALLKEWFDHVLAYGWAYGKDASALVGKRAKLGITTGGDAASYTEAGHNHASVDAFLLPITSTLKVCGMELGESFVVHNALHLAEEELPSLLQRYQSWLQAT